MKQTKTPERGVLYLVATPIGNLGDLTYRAVEVLGRVDAIACEDTRHSQALLRHYGIVKPLLTLHEHNEDRATNALLERLIAGEEIALISDAGTPLISDPGFPLVSRARSAGIRVTPIPGACALVTALSASGLATHRFAYEGFPPRKPMARRALFQKLRDEHRTLILYESSHRILATLETIAQEFPPERRLVIARELTKRFETILETTAEKAPLLLTDDPDQRLGEFVLVIEGAPETDQDELSSDQMELLNLLMAEVSLKTAVALTSRITGVRRESVYRSALAKASC